MNFPQLKTYTSKTNVEKMKIIAHNNKRAVSKELEYIVEKHIEEYESEYGEIIISETQEDSQ